MNPPRKSLPAAVWAQVKQLYLSGVSLGQIARQTGIPKGSLCARAHRESWSREKNDALALKEQIQPVDRAGVVAGIVAEHRLATLLREAKTAETLAKRAEEASRDVPVKTLDEIQQAQDYRQRLWPRIPAATGLENNTTLTLYFDHERKPDGPQGFHLSIVPKEGEQDLPGRIVSFSKSASDAITTP